MNRRAAALRLRDHVDDAREHRVGANFLGTHDEASSAVDSAADRFGARCFLDRHGFAGYHGFIERAATLNHYAIDRHGLAWPHVQPIADTNMF